MAYVYASTRESRIAQSVGNPVADEFIASKPFLAGALLSLFPNLWEEIDEYTSSFRYT